MTEYCQLMGDSAADCYSPGTTIVFDDGTTLEIVELIARGGQAAVYKVRCEGRTLAAKVQTRSDSNATKYLVREQTVVRRVASGSQYIVPLVTTRRNELGQWLLFEYVRGMTLKQVIGQWRAKQERVHEDEVLKWAAQLARALAVCHANGVVHRDLSTANILIDSDTQEIRLVDFGFARDFHDETTSTSDGSPGTWEYMPPESLGRDPEKAGTSADIWAVGAIMFECLTGTKLIDNILDAARVPRARPRIPNVRSRQPEIHPDLARIVARCLEIRPRKRYATADELLAAISDYAKQQERMSYVIGAIVKYPVADLRLRLDAIWSGIAARPWCLASGSVAMGIALCLLFVWVAAGFPPARPIARNGMVDRVDHSASPDARNTSTRRTITPKQMQAALREAVRDFLRQRISVDTGWFNRDTFFDTSLWINRPHHDLFVEVNDLQVEGQEFTFSVSASAAVRAMAAINKLGYKCPECLADAHLRIELDGKARIRDGTFQDCQLSHLDFSLAQWQFVNAPPLNVFGPMIENGLNRYIDSRKEDLKSLARDINGFRFLPSIVTIAAVPPAPARRS